MNYVSQQLTSFKFNYEWRGAHAGAEWLIKLNEDNAARRKQSKEIYWMKLILLTEWNKWWEQRASDRASATLIQFNNNFTTFNCFMN